MTPNDNTEIMAFLKEMDQKQDKLIERLFGSLDSENPKARFPQLEADVASLNTRTGSLEASRAKLFAQAGVVGLVLSYITSWFMYHWKR